MVALAKPRLKFSQRTGKSGRTIFTVIEAHHGSGSGSKVRVDRDAGIIYDVKIIGKVSRNKRIYEDAALDDALEVYEGTKVLLDHKFLAKTNSKLARSTGREMRDWAGVLQECRRTPDGIRGNLHYLKSTPAGEIVAEAAERFPDKFGLSHHACVSGHVRQADGFTIVERIDSVSSVDVVLNPATCMSLCEELNMDDTAVAAPPAAPSIEEGFNILVQAIMASPDHEDGDRPQMLKDLLKLKAKFLGTDAASADAAPADGADPAATTESVDSDGTPAQSPASRPYSGKKGIQRDVKEIKIRQLCFESGIPADEEFVQTMLDVADDRLAAHIAGLKKHMRRPYGSPQPPRSAPRRETVQESASGSASGSASRSGGGTQTAKIPDDPAKTRDWLYGIGG